MAVKIGFIGVGGMAEHHIHTLQKVAHATVTAVYDLNQSRSKEMAGKCGAVSYESSDSLMASGNVDALFICTPPFARDNIEETAAGKGIHILSEKPVGLDMKQSLQKEKAILASGIIHSSGYCLRYLDIVQKAKQYLAGKQIDLVMAKRFGDVPPIAWWTRMELSGGQLVEQSTHQLDLIRYLAGDFQEVHALHELRSIHKVDPQATAYDVGTVSFVLNSGAIGNITSTCLAKYVGGNAVEFFGHNFYLSIDGVTLRIVDDEQDIMVKSKNDFYLLQDTAFVEAVRLGRQSLVLGSYSEAVATLAVTLAANDSAVERKSVKLS